MDDFWMRFGGQGFHHCVCEDRGNLRRRRHRDSQKGCDDLLSYLCGGKNLRSGLCCRLLPPLLLVPPSSSSSVDLPFHGSEALI